MRRRPSRSAPRPGPTCVYQFLHHRTRAHLYIGITNSPRHRFAQHAGKVSGHDQKWWWVDADTCTPLITWYPSRRAASRAERTMIRRYRPPGNRQHNPDWSTPRRRVSRRAPSGNSPVVLAATGATVTIGGVLGWWPLPAPAFIVAVTVTVVAAWLTTGRRR